MATKRDMRRPDLIIPYQEPAAKDSADFSSTLSTTLPMAVMLTRNRFIGWASVVYSIQTWLGESEDQQKAASTPGYFNVGMAFISLAVTYLPLFMPPRPGATGTGPAAPVPPAQ